jgi:hypothetical protein
MREKTLQEMTRHELGERRASANRRCERYGRMGNEALFNIALQERRDVEEEMRKRQNA